MYKMDYGHHNISDCTEIPKISCYFGWIKSERRLKYLRDEIMNVLEELFLIQKNITCYFYVSADAAHIIENEFSNNKIW